MKTKPLDKVSAVSMRTLHGSPHKGRIPPKTALEAVSLKSMTLHATPVALILISLSLLILHRFQILPVSRVQALMADMTTPALRQVSQPLLNLADGFEGVRSLRDLKAENLRLKAENIRLQQWYEAALKFQAENKSLHDLLNVKADPQMTFVTSRVVSDPGGSFVKSVLLPVGAQEGIRKGSAVMSGRGLVGRVTEVGHHSSRVLLVTDLNSRLPVLISDTRTRAILAGKNGDLLRLERLAAGSGLSVGARVVTSGDGGLLPPDIPIGIIVAIDEQGILVKPLAALERLDWVQVINSPGDDSLVTGDIAPSVAD